MTEYAILFDTETTGLPIANSAPLTKQPQIIEYAGIKVDWETLEEVDRMTFLCKNKNPLESIIISITNLTDDDLKSEKPFSAHYKQLSEFHLGVSKLIAHNISFDRKLLGFELKRISKEFHFPYPPTHICTVEKSYQMNGHRMKLTDLHRHYYQDDERFHDSKGQYSGFRAHRAMNDTEALLDCVRGMRKDGLI